MRDFRATELIIAAAIALPVPFVAALGLAMTGVDRSLPQIDPGAGTPMRVKPVLDLDSPLIKLGGGKVKYKMPKGWADPVPHAPSRARVISSKQKEERDDKPKEKEKEKEKEPPKPDASAAPQASARVAQESPSAAPASSGDAEAPPGPGSPEGSPSGSPTGSPKGSLGGKCSDDPLKCAAAKIYYGRVQGWFVGRFHANCGALSAEDRKKVRAAAQVVIGGDGTVLSFSLTPSGNAEIDSAAQRAMQSAQGQQIPPPPEDYPELRPNSTTVTFVCPR